VKVKSFKDSNEAKADIVKSIENFKRAWNFFYIVI
jgi:hypothetical protein